LGEAIHPTQLVLAGKRTATHNGYANFAQAPKHMNPNQLTEQLGLFLDVLKPEFFCSSPSSADASGGAAHRAWKAVGSQLFIRSTHAVRATGGWPLPNGRGASSLSCNWPGPKRVLSSAPEG
jgi:hypothetical protein